ncbi:MAG: CsgG/HfaB family protein [Planctomycetaceae bacterium]|jgi:TolB-like protein|nr:CsgG/HfaB family protein [Planctomycetaceae bacterium]
MKRLLSIILLAALFPAGVFAEDEAVYPVAVLPFQDRSKEVAGQGKVVSDILFVNLVTNPAIVMVDREDLDTVLKEQEMNISGVVNPAEATQIGHLMGAKILVTGSILRVEKTVYIVAKIIGTETTRVLGASVNGGIDDPIDKLTEKLAQDITAVILKDADKLVAKPPTHDNRLEALKEKIKEKTLPTVMISIPETHINRQNIDPAAQTELSVFCTELGFTVLDRKLGDRTEADIMIVGEAFSERGLGIGNLISVKARVEVKAIDRKSGKIIAIDRQTTVAVDLAETIAAKNALQQAGAALAERVIPKIVQ